MWDATFDDSIYCLKLLPSVAALIYTEKFDKQAASLSNHDWAG